IAYGLITSRHESGHTLTGIGGSNPSLSASFPLPPGSRVNCGASAELREQSKRAKQRSVAELLEKVPPRKRTYLNGYRGFNSSLSARPAHAKFFLAILQVYLYRAFRMSVGI